MAEFGKWTRIGEELPCKGEYVLFCCYIEDEGFGEVNFGWYEGDKTLGDAIVMQTVPGDPGWWYPCTHWMPLPPVPEIPND
ncbi:MAG: hypothetical protein ACK52I_29655 [Pseudomonadota bacterium]|jgi:hypothetical protein